MIVTYTPTIMDGPVLRWHASEAAAKAVRPVVSASRNGVRIDGWLHDIPPTLLAIARDAWQEMCRGGDVKHLATHHLNLRGDELTPIRRQPNGCEE